MSKISDISKKINKSKSNTKTNHLIATLNKLLKY